MENKSSQSTAEAAADLVKSPVFPFSYHEISQEKHVVRTDVLEQLKANMNQLEDLHARLKFMMGEVRYLIKRG